MSTHVTALFQGKSYSKTASSRQLHIKIIPIVGIHEHNIDKRLESFALCYSQLLLLADFSPLYDFLRLEFSTATAGGDLALSLFTFKTTILKSFVSFNFLFK